MKMPKYMVFHVSHFGGTARDRPWCIGVRVDEHQDKLSVRYKPFLLGFSRFSSKERAQRYADELNEFSKRLDEVVK